MTRQQLILSLVITAFYLVGQLLVGTDVTVAALFAIAILFGTLSIFAGGGLKSAFGCLNAILIGKFLLLGIALKIILLDPADTRLAAPHTTALVMATGFLGVYLGTMIQSRLHCPQSFSMNRPLDNETLLAVSIALFVVTYGAYFVSLIPSVHGEGSQAGGWIGITRSLESLKSFSIVPPLLYLWRVKSPQWMTHPVILTMLTWCVLLGIFSTGKQEAMEPLVFYLLLGFLRYGWRDVRLWALLMLAVLYYVVIIYPYANYVRWAGGRQGTIGQRAEVTRDIFWRMVSDPEFRSSITDLETKGPNYFGRESLAPLNRLSMVSEADRLIFATQQKQVFTRWETIVWGFQLAIPSFLYPEKPHFEAGNYLGRYVGDIVPSDLDTQVSYGFMANLYNAFSIPGVLIGTSIFFAGFYYWIGLFVGEPRWDGEPGMSTLWFIWLLASLQHGIVESSLSGIIPFVMFPFSFVLFYLIAKGIGLIIPRMRMEYEMVGVQESKG